MTSTANRKYEYHDDSGKVRGAKGFDNANIMLCASCDSEAPLQKYECHTEASMAGGRGLRTEDRMLCEVCACTMVSNATGYPSQHRGQIEILRTIAMCTNLVLDAVTGRRNNGENPGP